MIEIRVRKGEPLDEALVRFERKVVAEGILQDFLRHSHYHKPSAASRLKHKRHSRFAQPW